MNKLTLQQVAEMAEGLLYRGHAELTIDQVHFDSRQLGENGLFIAISGNRDGHQFLEAAAAQGAKAAIISDERKIPSNLSPDFGLILVNDTLRAFHKLAAAYRRKLTMPFIAVTGSNGKTTTKDMIAHLLSSRLPVYQTYKNLNNHLGVPYSLLQVEPTHRAVVLELGMNHAGEIDQLASLVKPAISVITTIGDAHLEYFRLKEKIALAKAELLPHTEPDGLVLLNGDNPYLRQIASLYQGEIQYFSLTQPADIWAEQLETTETGTRFTVRFADGNSFSATMPLYGDYNVANLLPAIAIARRFGLSFEEISASLETLKISGMRFEVMKSPQGAIMINDAYNASPLSMKASLDTFSNIYSGYTKIAVLGDMYELGAAEGELLAEVGRYANQYQHLFDMIVTIGENSRYLHEAYNGEKRHFATKQEAETFLRPLLDEQAVFLFKASRGVELETLIEALLN